MTVCRCKSLESISGRSGQDYARDHLQEVLVDDKRWLALHRCPITNIYWRESFPRSEEHGGGPPLYEKITDVQAAEEFGV